MTTPPGTVSLPATSQGRGSSLSELEDFRQQKDEVFRQHPESPLTPEQKQGFQRLRYYPENPALSVRAFLDRNVSHDVLEMDTSTGSKQTYTREGKITFRVDDQETDLYLYSTGDPHELFVPFRDATSGKETYGAGRYLEAPVAEDGTILVDFNYAYNPYCAYNERWSCPLPPLENWLKAPIRAGEMAFDEQASDH